MSELLAQTVSVTKSFDEVLAVDEVSLEVGAGEVVGLLGANGAGKTTLIKMLLGLLRPTTGGVQILGRPPTREARRHLGYMPQGLGLYSDLTVAENLRFVANAYEVHPPVLDGDLGAVVDVPISALSLGLRRRAAFAAALCHDPRLLVLDEPTSGVGPLGRADLWDTIHQAADSGSGVLVTTHYMDEAEQCDRLVVLAAGRQVAAGTVADIVEGKTTTEVRPLDPTAAIDMLEAAGLAVVPSGDRLRVPGVGIDTVRQLLDGSALEMIEDASSLEEAFMTLVSTR